MVNMIKRGVGFVPTPEELGKAFAEMGHDEQIRALNTIGATFAAWGPAKADLQCLYIAEGFQQGLTSNIWSTPDNLTRDGRDWIIQLAEWVQSKEDE